MGKIKHSHGMAICSLINGVPHILLMRRRLTYNFIEFITGVNNWQKMEKLLNGMTASEKLELLSGNFAQIWWKLNLNNNTRCPVYKTYELKYNSLDKERLLHLINNSTDGDLIWEMPKGRIERPETGLDAAIRETKEEIGVDRSQYKLLGEEFYHSLVDYDVRYTMKIYLAEATKNISLAMKDRHLFEVDTVRWFSLDQLVTNTPYYNLICEILKKYTEIKLGV